MVVVPWNVTSAILIGGTLVIFLLSAFGIGVVSSFALSGVAFALLSVQGVIALGVSFFGFLVMFFTTGGFAVGGVAIFGPFVFIGMVIAAFISTLGF